MSSGQRAELAEGQRLADVERQRARRLGGDEGALDQTVGGEGRHAERTGRHDDAGQEADDGAGDDEVPEAEFQVARGKPAAAGHHDEEERGRARCRRRARAGSARCARRAPPPGCRPAHRRRTARQSISFHHDVILAKFDIRATIAMIGTASRGPNAKHQHGQQDDGGAGADDAAHRAGDEADDEDEGVGQHGFSSRCSAAATSPPARSSSRGAWRSPRAGRGRCAPRRNTAPRDGRSSNPTPPRSASWRSSRSG